LTIALRAAVEVTNTIEPWPRGSMRRPASRALRK
jgi:hypothetical protein